MIKLETKADLDNLVTERIPESLVLDYKAAFALGKSSQLRNELFKDVSAFANSAGGQIVYGIEEKNQLPVKVQTTDAVDPAEITPD